MERKSVIVGVLIVLVAIIAAAAVFTGGYTVKEQGTFCLSDYYNRPFENDKYAHIRLDSITGAEAAAKEAQKLWKKIYGAEFSGIVCVSYDKNNYCYLIETIPTIQSLANIGAVDGSIYIPCALIFEDGRVLEVWLGQM